MTFKSDIEIAQATEMRPIDEIAKAAAISPDHLEHYGKYKAKVSLDALAQSGDKQQGKLILMTAITPTPAGEGKTTTTIGLADALARLGKKSTVALREPSMGPVFGIKGGEIGRAHV